MCEWGTDSMVEIVQRRIVGIDACIAEEIVWLNEQGVHTINSCCGHGKFLATAIIWPHSVHRALELGYEPSFSEDTDPRIELRGLCRQPPRGWRCTRSPNHEGPCAAVPMSEAYQYIDDLGPDLIDTSD